jgi:hypothetical protein
LDLQLLILKGADVVGRGRISAVQVVGAEEREAGNVELHIEEKVGGGRQIDHDTRVVGSTEDAANALLER